MHARDCETRCRCRRGLPEDQSVFDGWVNDKPCPHQLHTFRPLVLPPFSPLLPPPTSRAACCRTPPIVTPHSGSAQRQLTKREAAQALDISLAVLPKPQRLAIHDGRQCHVGSAVSTRVANSLDLSLQQVCSLMTPLAMQRLTFKSNTQPHRTFGGLRVTIAWKFSVKDG